MSEELIKEIVRLKNQKNAVILAHNYQLPEVQDIADLVGDSLALSIEASKTDADIIVSCGVHFMAETAKIINPSKTVLMPDVNAGCPMANMVSSEALRLKALKHQEAVKVCYINTTAEVKAQCDICCTSGNAIDVVSSLGDKEIIFVPDQYLGSWVEEKLGRKMILWPGFCNIHVKILPEHILKAKNKYPAAKVMAHPECTPAVRKLSDLVASTSKMVDYPLGDPAKEYIVASETGILHQLNKKYPEKQFYAAYDGAVCPNMKLTVLEKVLWCLEEGKEEVVVPEKIAEKARICIDRMLALK